MAEQKRLQVRNDLQSCRNPSTFGQGLAYYIWRWRGHCDDNLIDAVSSSDSFQEVATAQHPSLGDNRTNLLVIVIKKADDLHVSAVFRVTCKSNARPSCPIEQHPLRFPNQGRSQPFSTLVLDSAQGARAHGARKAKQEIQYDHSQRHFHVA